MKKSLENQFVEARENTKKVFDEFYKESKYEIIIIWILLTFSILLLVALLF